MSELSDFDVEVVWIRNKKRNGETLTAHLDADCRQLEASDGEPDAKDVSKLHTDTDVCQYCNPAKPDSYGGNNGGPSLAQQLRYGYGGAE
jgi:hypothetical protein